LSDILYVRTVQKTPTQTGIKTMKKFMKIAMIAIMDLVTTFTAAHAFTIDKSYTVEFPHLDENHRKGIYSMSRNIYHEARGEGEKGWAAVMTVTLARLNSGKHGIDICDVVYEPHQFSWTDENPEFNDPEAFAKVVNYVLDTEANGFFESPIKSTVMYYHTKDVNPTWDDTLTKVAKIGQHLFYQ